MKKPQLTSKQIKEIHWLEDPKDKGDIRVGRYNDYWILNQKKPESPILVYNQTEWDAFVSGVNNHEFDDLAKIERM